MALKFSVADCYPGSHQDTSVSGKHIRQITVMIPAAEPRQTQVKHTKYVLPSSPSRPPPAGQRLLCDLGYSGRRRARTRSTHYAAPLNISCSELPNEISKPLPLGASADLFHSCARGGAGPGRPVETRPPAGTGDPTPGCQRVTAVSRSVTPAIPAAARLPELRISSGLQVRQGRDGTPPPQACQSRAHARNNL